MKTFGLNQYNDLHVDDTGNLDMITGIDAIAQTAKNRAATKRGELIYAILDGMPFFDAAFDHGVRTAQYEAAIRRVLGGSPGVESVKVVAVTLSDDTMEYVATLVTSNGEVTING